MKTVIQYRCGVCAKLQPTKDDADRCCLPEFRVGQVWKAAPGRSSTYAVVYKLSNEYVYFVTSEGATYKELCDEFVRIFPSTTETE